MTDPFEKEEYKQNPFRNSRGALRTHALFYDITYDPEIAMYCLKGHDMKKDGKVFLSLKQLYLSYEDITEYEFAVNCFEGWHHWLAVSQNRDVAKQLDQWREELEIKFRSKAIKSIANQALDPNKPSYQAAAFIADRKWIQNGKGAPTKDQVEGERKRQAFINDEVEDHINRMADYH